MAEIVPFFATTTEKAAVDGLPKDTKKLEDIVSAVPKFKDVVSGDLLVQWVFTRPRRSSVELCEIHVYKRDRKELFDKTEAALRDMTDPEAKSKLIASANKSFEEMAWWPNFEEVFYRCLSDHFKGVPGSAGYHREVDSWSASLLMDNAALGMWSPDHLDAFADKLSAKLKG